MAFDFIDGNNGTYVLYATNIETGDVTSIRANDELNYPNYSNDDDQIIFNAENTLGDKVVASIGVQSDKITADGDAFVLLSNGFSGTSWGTWFSNGERELVDVDDVFATQSWAKVYPTLSHGQVELEWELADANQVEINITDLLGHTIMQESSRFAAGKHQKSLSLDLPSGVYLVQLQAGKLSFVERVIIE